MTQTAILFSEMTPESHFAADFHEWYDTEHIPVRMNAPGFVGAQRYSRVDNPGFLAVYELATVGALQTREYQKIKSEPSSRTQWMLANVADFTRYTCRPIGVVAKQADSDVAPKARFLYAVWFTVPPAELPEFDDWYVQDHLPLLMKCSDWIQVRRFDVVSGEPGSYNRLALHYLDKKSALDSPERAAARNTDWRKRLAERSWFKGDYALFESHGGYHEGFHPEL